MELTEAHSAGISLYEAKDGPGIFRWKHLQGVLARFDGATTPRDDSPCGVTLDRELPVVMQFPERRYEWIKQAGISVPEVLLVPLYIGSAEPLGTLWVVAEKPGHFCRDDVSVLAELAEFVGFALQASAQERRLQADLAEQRLLAREMSHRVKNVFAVAQGMIRASARHASSPIALAEALAGRLAALAQAHGLVTRSVGNIGNRAVLDLSETVAAVLEAHDPLADSGRLEAEGPRVELGPHAGNGLVLVLHELATNSVKYGALASKEGRLTVSWRWNSDKLVLRWEESGGATIAGPPEGDGFGTMLIRRIVSAKFGGSLAFEWRESGLAVDIAMAKDRLAN